MMGRGLASPVALVGLLLLTAALYTPWRPRAFVMDDLVYIARNPAVVAGAPLARYFTDRATGASDAYMADQSWRPLRTLAFRAVALVGGARPLAFGAANLLLYLGAVLLVRALALRLGASPRAATVAAALWAVLPVHVEPVLYASALGDHLSLVLELGALLLGLRALGADRPLAPAAAAGALTALALGAKEMAVTAPALLLLVAWGTGAWRTRRALLLAAALGAVVLLYLAARTRALGVLGHGETTAAGAGAALAVLPVRLAAYVRAVLAPLGHHPAYVLPATGAGLLAASWLLLAAAAAGCARLPRTARVGVVWFVVALAPVLGLVPILAALADRFALLPSVGLALAAAPAVDALERRWPRAGLLAPGLLAAVYAAAVLVEAPAWASDGALWGKATALEPRSAQAQRNLGLVHLEEGRPDRALAHLDRARELGDAAPDLEYWRALALQALGRGDEAMAAAGRARSGRARALWGVLAIGRGARAQAEAALVEARRLEPTHPNTRALEVEVAAARGDRAGAVRAAERLAAEQPGNPRWRHRLAVAYAEAGDHRAADAARACLRLAPGHPLCACLLGRVLVDAGERGPEARAALDAAVRLPPGPERAACEAARGRL